MQEDAGVRQSYPVPVRSGHQQEGSHGASGAHAHRSDGTFDPLHGVVDRKTASHYATGRVDVHGNWLLRILRFEKKELCVYQGSDTVLDRPVHEDDAVAQKTREDVKRPFAAGRLFDHHWDEIGTHHAALRNGASKHTIVRAFLP